MNWFFRVGHFITILFIAFFSSASMADGTVTDAEVIIRDGYKNATTVKMNADVSTIADKRCNDPISILINKDEDNKQTEFRTYSLETKKTTNDKYFYTYSESEDKLPAGSEIEVDTLFLSKELISRLSDKQFSAQQKQLKKLLNASGSDEFQQLIFGKPVTATSESEEDLSAAQKAQMLEYRGLIELGRDSTQYIHQDRAWGAQLREKFRPENLAREVYATGYMKTADGKLLRISDVLSSGIQLETDDVGKMKTRLLKATAFSLIDSVAKKVGSDTDISDIKEFFSNPTTDDDDGTKFCSSNCDMPEKLGDSLANLVQITATDQSPLTHLYCLLKEIDGICYDGKNSKLNDLLTKYKPENTDGLDCLKNKPVVEEENQGLEEEEEAGGDDETVVEGVEIKVTQVSRKPADKYVVYRAELTGDKADEVKPKGKFFWTCDDSEEKKCEDQEDQTRVTYEELPKDVNFSVTVSFKASKDADDLATPAKIDVNFECDPEEEDCEEECDEDEEDCEDDDRERPYSWRDFMNQDNGLPENYPPPPPRFQPTMLPPRRGMTVTPAIP